MPLSFRRSFKKKPGAQLGRRKRSVALAAATPASASNRLRSPKYPLGALIGLGVVIVVGAVVIVSSGPFGLPGGGPASTQAIVPTAPVATGFNTAIAARVGTLAAGVANTRPAPPVASSSPTRVSPTITRTPPASATLRPSNPWSAQIPEASCIRADLPQRGLVVGVLDGDTIRVRLDGGEGIYSVRYVGVEAPPTGQYYAAISAGRNAELVYLKQATLVRDLTDSDPQGTLLRYVIAEGKFVNYELIAGGYAQAISAAPDTACRDSFESAQREAQFSKLGLWSAPSYLIPFSPTP